MLDMHIGDDPLVSAGKIICPKYTISTRYDSFSDCLVVTLSHYIEGEPTKRSEIRISKNDLLRYGPTKIIKTLVKVHNEYFPMEVLYEQ